MSAIGVDIPVVAVRMLVLLLVSWVCAMGIVAPVRASASAPAALVSTDFPRHLLARQDPQTGQKKKKKSSSFLQQMLEEKLRDEIDEDDQAIIDALRQRERNQRSDVEQAARVQQQAATVSRASEQTHAQPITRAAAGANGLTVSQVTFGQQGQRLGQFQLTAPGQWQESGATGNGFIFQETNRDDWSVYLSDPSRGVRIQLDLHRKLVLYQDEGAPGMRPLYEIMSASASAPVLAVASAPQPAMAPSAATAPRAAATMGVDGRTVTQATFGQQGRPLGQFRQTGARSWQETSGSGDGFTFEESDRDDWSVYLLDASRGVRIQLDLHRKLVLYAEGSSAEMSPLYEILSAGSPAVATFRANSPSPSPPRSEPPAAEQPSVAPARIDANGRTVTQASFGQQGRVIGQYLQIGPGRWRENGQTGGGFDFEEINRDDWSVYLHDRSRNVRVQIDLYRKQVLYAGGGASEMTPLYEILSAGSPRVAPLPSGISPTQAQSPGSDPAYPQSTAGGNDSASRKDFCWKDSYGRGVGGIPESCGAGRERLGLLCYTKCPINSQRFGLDCHTVCPSEMRDDGLFCRAAEYGRGAGFPVHFGEFDGDGMKRRCEAQHGRGQCEMNGLIYYPKCKAGYSAFGCCMCRPNPPNCSALGMNPGIDLSCAKRVEIGDPQTGTCAAGMEKDGGLCYPQCKAGYTGVGPVCWAAPPSSWVGCGMGAARNSQVCGEIVFGQVASVGQVAFNLATLGSGTAASGAASTASKAGRLADLKRRYEQLRSLYKANENSIRAALAAKQAHGATVHAVELMDAEVVTEEDIVRIAAEIAAIADPSGVSDTVAAYTYPVCSKYGF